MPAPFSKEEYQVRLSLVRKSMIKHDLDALLIGDPANMNWLTGFDAWSFYVPQVMLVQHDQDPIWMGRKMDAGAVRLTTHLDQTSVMPYGEDFVQRAGPAGRYRVVRAGCRWHLDIVLLVDVLLDWRDYWALSRSGLSRYGCELAAWHVQRRR